jgi:hypothetical protein
MVRRYGCFDRADYKPAYDGQCGWVKAPDGTARAKLAEITFRGTHSCQYKMTELGKVDPRCEGCSRKLEPEPEAA